MYYNNKFKYKMETKMKLSALAKKEGQDILKNKIYLGLVFVQIFILLGTFGIALATSIASDPSLIDHYGATSALKVGVPESIKGSLLEEDLLKQNLNLTYFKNISNAQKFLGTTLVAVVGFNSSSGQNLTVNTDTSNVFYPVVSSKINKAINEYQTQKKLASTGLNNTEIQKILNPVNLQVVNLNEDHPSNIALDSSYFVEIMYGFIVPFILLLPFFLASNIVTDSIVGERERKTFEVLLMTPISSSMVMLGKTLPILFFSLIQSVAWIILLDLLKVPIYNPLFMFALLFFMGLGFIGIGILLSMFVDSTKEANSAITIVLVFATFILFMPLFIKTSYFTPILNYIPTVIMVKMASTPNINFDIIISALPTILISILIFGFTVRYFRRERAIRL
jgi:ABC-2 type transport system permease protein